MNDINIDEKLNKIDIDIDKLLIKIENINRQIDDIEIGYLSQTDAVYSIELLEHIKERKNTLNERKRENRVDIDALRVTQQKLIELKVINQYSLISPETLQIILSIRSSDIPQTTPIAPSVKVHEKKPDQKSVSSTFSDIFDTNNGFDIYAGHYVIKNSKFTSYIVI